jgi:L-gulono-1,4-lactone dehydrogenase
MVGSGHSFTAAAVTDGILVQLDRYQQVLNIDTSTRQVTVEAGITLTKLNEVLDARGLAMANLGDIAYQTISGAISTSTHGTGIALTGIAGQVAALRIITSTGEALNCNPEENADIFHAARVGVGVLGALSTVTINVVPAFGLRVVEEPMRVDAVLADLDGYVEDNDHFEFYWVPHTGWALTKRNNRTTDPLAPPSRFSHFKNKVVLENYAFGAVCRLGRIKPTLIPKLARALPSTGKTEFVDQSYKVFASTRLVKFYEMEYSIERAACAEALNRVRAFVKQQDLMLNFPVEVRFTAPDDIPLSTGTARQSAYIAVHIFQKMDSEQYFNGVEAIMNDYGGRPHWGKLHRQTAATLAPKYPQWDAFIAARDRLDPDGRFTNDYAKRVFGR